jgi:CBS domain-containing protein
MKAKDVMMTGVISVTPETPVIRAAELMLQYDISGFPVIERSGKLVGIVTEGDLLRRVETGTERSRTRRLDPPLGPGRLADEYVHAHGRTVGQIMSREVATVTEEAPLGEIVAVMESRRIKRVVVLRSETVVGIVSRRDLLHALVVGAKKAAPSPGGDGMIRERILAEIAKETWVPPRPVGVSVREGVVELRGVIADERQRLALRVLAENVPGVKEVHDRLVWTGSDSGFDS